jgi:mRNA-degrading endonuclease YafQ of YafQ-DinJ toxin-antitoxin module
MVVSHIISYTRKFRRAFEKLTGGEQDLVMGKIKILKSNPFYPSLRSKKLKGKPGYYESSVNMDIRIIWRFSNGRIIILLNIGHHDILENY